MNKILIISVMLLFSIVSYSQNLSGDFFSLSKIKNNLKSRHISTHNSTGGNADSWEVKKGKKLSIMDVRGSGVINRIWINIAPTHEILSRNDIVIRMY